MSRDPHGRRALTLGLRAAIVVLVAATALPFASAATGAQTGGNVDVTRLWGQDRHATSLAVAQRFEQEAGGSIDAAVLVSGQSWHDAVIAAGLAGSLDAPVLLTQKDEVPSATADFLSEAGVARVVVVGTTSAVSEEVLTSLQSLGNVERIEGPDPSAASVAVAQRMGPPGAMPGHGRTVIVASSEVFADAMVAGPFSARGGHPVLLTPPDELDDGVKSYVSQSGAEHVIILGGTAAVSSSVQDELAALDMAVTRLGGTTRLHTAQFVADFLQGKYTEAAGEPCFDRSTAGLATAWVPFDAFGAGPLLGKLCAPLLLTDPKQMDPAIERWIKRSSDALLVFGGKTAVSSHALADLNDDAALESIFDNAADERAKIVARLTSKINEGSYGVNANNLLRGPAGFRIDLDDCPARWSDTTGITDTEIRIGHTTPQTGSLAAFSGITVGMQNYFDWVNENDPVAGRQLTLEARDDSYRAEVTVELVYEMIESENVFSISTIGTASTLLTYDMTNRECVPHPFATSASPAFGDPVRHPWTTGIQMSSSTEALLWGAWIERSLRDKLPVKVVGLVMDNRFGWAYQDAFKAWAQEHPDVVSEFVAVRHYPPKQDLADEMEMIQSLSPDVYISMTAGNPCVLAIQAAGENGLIADVKARGGALFTPSVCESPSAYLQPAGGAADGWLIARGGERNTADFANAGLPFVKFVNRNLEEAELELSNSLYGRGYAYGYAYVEALRVAADLPGGLTRSNFIMALRSLDITHPLYLDGIRFRMNGNADAHFVEGSEFARYHADDFSWKPVGPVIDVNGQTPNCAWDLNEGRCH
ncbi:cell wall-binding repeat-containing protein [Candidatus Poriferisodalis sp.]|uniref:cell wall-binding repeat-containing protein n=1 Tax=Candidatus Poriferisodalis sp. TaxID=3101277 RepID=UPI003B521682